MIHEYSDGTKVRVEPYPDDTWVHAGARALSEYRKVTGTFERYTPDEVKAVVAAVTPYLKCEIADAIESNMGEAELSPDRLWVHATDVAGIIDMLRK